jgi:hypothetical protein
MSKCATILYNHQIKVILKYGLFYTNLQTKLNIWLPQQARLTDQTQNLIFDYRSRHDWPTKYKTLGYK